MKLNAPSLTASLIFIAAIYTTPIQANAQTFQPSFNISDSAGGVEDAQITAIGSSLYVVWSDSTSGNFDILFRRSTDAGTTWEPTINLSNSPISSRVPHIAASGSNIFIVWDEFSDFNAPHKIMHRRSTDGGATFLPTQQLSDEPASGQYCFADVAASGDLVFPYWRDCRTDTLDQTYYRRSSNAGASFDPVTLTPGAGGTFANKIVVTGINVYILTTSVVPPSGALLLRRSFNGGVTFDAAKTIWPTSVDAAKIVVNGNNIYVVFRPQSQFGNPNINFIHSADAGTTFSPSINLSNVPSGGGAHSPNFTIIDRNIYVTWSESDPVTGGQFLGTRTDTFFRRSTDNGVTFEPRVNLSNNKKSSNHEIAASGNQVYVVWGDYDGITTGTAGIVLRASDDRGATFNAPILLSSGGQSIVPQLAALSGNVGVIWKDFLVNNGDILFRRSTPAPMLFTYENSARAIALDSVTMVRDPFTITTPHNFSADQRTRLVLFATNAALLPGETASIITAQAENAQHQVFPLPVEFIGQVPGFAWLIQINVKLPDELMGAGDVQVSIRVRGLVSNKAVISIQP